MCGNEVLGAILGIGACLGVTALGCMVFWWATHD